MFKNDNNIEKLKPIITYLGLGNTTEIRSFLKRLNIQDNLSETDLKLFEELIYVKTLDMINTDVINIDQYGLKFFTQIRELKLKHIEALLLKKGFPSEKTSLNNLPKSQTFFNHSETLKQSETLASDPDLPIDLSKTGPFGHSIKI